MKQLSYILAAVGILILSACNNNDMPDVPIESLISYDGEKEMFRNFFTTDDAGEVQDYIIGVPLDSDNLDVTSCSIESLDKAREMFLAMIPDDGKVERKSDGSIVYTPVQHETYYKWSGDTLDNPTVVRVVSKDQPTVTFMPVEQNNLMATVTFASSNSPIKRVEILYNWQLNSDSEYLEGEITKRETLFHKMENFVCIREASNGVAGVLLYFSPETREVRSTAPWLDIEKNRNGKLITDDIKKMPNKNQMEDYWKIIHSNKERWDSNFRVAGGKEVPQYETYYWYGEDSDLLMIRHWMALRYSKTGKPETKGCNRMWGKEKFHYWQHYTFNYVPPKK